MNKIKQWNKTKKAVLALNLLCLVVLLAYSITFFVINQIWQPGNLPQGAMHTRMAWRQIVDNIAFAATAIYQIGGLFFIYRLFRGKITIPVTRLLLYFGAQLCGMLLCTIPFGMIDSTTSVATYIFPLWNIGSWAIIFLLFTVGMQVYWQIKGQAK